LHLNSVGREFNIETYGTGHAREGNVWFDVITNNVGLYFNSRDDVRISAKGNTILDGDGTTGNVAVGGAFSTTATLYVWSDGVAYDPATSLSENALRITGKGTAVDEVTSLQFVAGGPSGSPGADIGLLTSAHGLNGLSEMIFHLKKDLTAWVEPLRLTCSGVGIFEQNPQYSLDVNGDARIQGGAIISDNLGIGTDTPSGTLDVNGAIYQRGGELHADYVFEDDYQLESIEEHSEFMWKNKHLKSISKIEKDASGKEVIEIGSHRRGILEELEKAHVYIEQLHRRIKVLEEKI